MWYYANYLADYLAHYGIKGQKWGIRRTPAQLGHKPSSKKKHSNSLFKIKSKQNKKKVHVTKTTKQTDTIQQKPKPKTVKDMSDQELNAIVNRLQLEQRYNQLNPRKVSAGKRFASKLTNDVIVPAATEASKQFLKEQIYKQMNSAAKKYANNK